MKFNIALLEADIRDEIENLRQLSMEYSSIENLLELTDEEVSFSDKAAASYFLHSFYNGCENIFGMIARKPSVTSSLNLTLIVLRLARVIASISAIVNRPCSLMMESICAESSERLTIIFSRSIFFANLSFWVFKDRIKKTSQTSSPESSVVRVFCACH